MLEFFLIMHFMHFSNQGKKDETIVHFICSAGTLIPKYYYVPHDRLEAERKKPGSQRRISSSEGEDGNIFLWGQAVYIISQLLRTSNMSTFNGHSFVQCDP